MHADFWVVHALLNRLKLPSRPRALALSAAAALAGLLVCSTGPALADSSQPETTPISGAHPGGKIFGVVPSGLLNAPGQDGKRYPLSGGFAHGLAGQANMTYHGGPVLTSSSVYEVFWTGPSGSIGDSNYASNLQKFEQDVQAAGGATTNVYSTDTQYYEGTNTHIAYNISYLSSLVDKDAIPSDSACTSAYGRSGVDISGGCITDTDMQNEINSLITNNKLPEPAANELVLVFTPENVGSCFSTYCAYSYYCAYHSSFTDSNNNNVLYANMPYPDNANVQGACDLGEYPNGDVSDATASLISHEQNETITDPFGTAWFDGQGNEIGDKCAWTFGATQGGLGSEFNQVVNSNDYFLQQEWSNASSSCVQQYAPPAAPTVTSLSPTSGPVGTSVTITGTGFSNTSSVTFNGVAASSVTVNSATQITATVPSSATTGPVAVSTAAGTSSNNPTFTLTAPAGTYSLSATPATASVAPGSRATFTVTVSSANGFTSPVSLNVNGLPGGRRGGGATASFSPSSVVPSGGGTNSTLTISTTSRTNTGTFTLTITGTSGATRESTTVKLTVT